MSGMVVIGTTVTNWIFFFLFQFSTVFKLLIQDLSRFGL